MRQENKTLNLIKKKKDEELVLAKKEIKLLSLRVTEAEDQSRVIYNGDFDSLGKLEKDLHSI